MNYKELPPHECRCEVCGRTATEIRSGWIAGEDAKQLIDALRRVTLNPNMSESAINADALLIRATVLALHKKHPELFEP